jgi:catechol 2,3-dioxygenase-like lactoylglutathione lyase family enzyme
MALRAPKCKRRSRAAARSGCAVLPPCSTIWEFSAPTSPVPPRSTTRAFFDAAVGAGAEALHEPREWPEYHPAYYGAFVRDPDGNNIEAVCHHPELPQAR